MYVDVIWGFRVPCLPCLVMRCWLYAKTQCQLRLCNFPRQGRTWVCNASIDWSDWRFAWPTESSETDALMTLQGKLNTLKDQRYSNKGECLIVSVLRFSCGLFSQQYLNKSFRNGKLFSHVFSWAWYCAQPITNLQGQGMTKSSYPKTIIEIGYIITTNNSSHFMHFFIYSEYRKRSDNYPSRYNKYPTTILTPAPWAASLAR